MRITIEVNSPQWSAHAVRKLKWGVLALALLVALAVPTLVFSGHQFTDVPDTHVFHTEISNLVGAGITSGCATGQYCPDAPVIRASMAAFLGRTASRVGASATLLTPTVGDRFVNVATKIVVIPGAAGATQFAKVEGFVTVFNSDGNPQACPCNVTARLVDLTSGAISVQVFDRIKPATGGGFTSYDQITLFIAWVFPVPTATSRTFALQVLVVASSPLNLANPGLAITSHPFGATGGGILGPEFRNPEPPAIPSAVPGR